MSRRGDFARLRFCPRCGVEAIEKDLYREAKNFPVPEYWCRICGFGFRIGPSARVALADRMFAEHRRVRNGALHEHVRPGVARRFLNFLEGGGQ